MADFKINGKMLVKILKRQFKEAFGLLSYFFIGVLVLFFLNTNVVSAQALKTYSGPYSLSNPQLYSAKANATYTYYIKDGEQIKHGRFVIKISNGEVTINITGNYSNGLKEGLWEYQEYENTSSNVVKNNLKANYSKGLPHGSWVGTSNARNTLGSGTASYNANFYQGIVVGSHDYKSENNYEYEKVSVKLNKEGLLEYYSVNDKTWRYYKGILISDNYSNAEMDEILEFYEKHATNEDSLKNYRYRLTEKYMYLRGHDYFFSYLHHYDDITGDVNYVETVGRKVTYNYGGLKYYIIETQKTSTDKYNDEVTKADNYFNQKRYSEAREAYQKALSFKKAAYAEQKLKEIDAIFENMFQSVVKKGDSLFRLHNFKEAYSYYESSLSIKKSDYCNAKMREINDMKHNPDKYASIAHNFAEKKQLDSMIHYYKSALYFANKQQYIPFMNSFGRDLLINKEYNDALNIFLRIDIQEMKRSKMYPNIVANLAHAYLLTGNEKKAEEIYYDSNSYGIDSESWEKLLEDDLKYFESMGIDCNKISKIIKKIKRKRKTKQIGNFIKSNLD